MKIPLLGLSIIRTKAAAGLSRVDTGGGGGWWPIIRESYTGAWQASADVTPATALAYWALYACVTLIAEDIAKMGVRLMALGADGIWSETTSPAFSPVLRKPNHYQTRIQFIVSWLASKLSQGNAYVLKQRDGRGLVRALYVLNPAYVTPLVASDGSVYYELRLDGAVGAATLAGLGASVTLPAREIIHDVCVPLFHPLIGVTPIYACGTAAWQGLRIQDSSTRFFANGSNPGGVLSAPGAIGDETAERVKAFWETGFSGNNAGKVAVLGDGLKYEPLGMKAIDAQLIDQLKWTGEAVCGAYHVPPHLVGVGPAPTYNNIEALSQQYYSQCLQAHIEALELLLDEGLALPADRAVEFAVEDLIRMDSQTRMKTAADGIAGGVFTPNEARRLFNRAPIDGGNTVYLQQQMYSLEALMRRDRAAPAPASGGMAPAAPAAPAAEDDPAATAEGKGFAVELARELSALLEARGVEGDLDD